MPEPTRAISKLINYRQRPLHISWLLSYFALSTIIGIAISAALMNPILANVQIVLAVAALISIILTRRRITTGLVVVAILAGLLLGVWRGEERRMETFGYRSFIGSNVHLSGMVADDVVEKGGAKELKLCNVKIERVRLGGQVWVSSSTGLHLKRGDRVELEGALKPGFGSYAASMSFAKVTGALRAARSDPSRSIRDTFDQGLKRTIPEPEASLAIGYLAGQHNQMPTTLYKQMQVTGLIHLVIAGGYNVTILVRLVRRFCARFAKRLAAIMSSCVLLLMTSTAGFVAPMARTTVVTSLCLAAWYYGRWPHPMVLLPVAAAITAVIEPSFVWGDVGWYMTFIAYGGLIVLGPMLKKWWWGDSHSGEVKQIIVDTIAVQVVTTPLMAFAFQQYSVYGLPANLLVLPLMSLTMLSATAAGLSGMILPLVPAQFISLPANILLSYTHKVTVWMAGAPGANTGGGLSLHNLVAAYLGVLIFIYWLKLKTGYDFRAENPVD